MTHGVVWHELECHGYTADLGVWRDLALSPVLDVGAGTGRVALDLVGRGHEVVALDSDAELLGELSRRAPGIETVRAGAEAFDLGRRFASILMPMQTIQLLGDRRAFLRCARAHLERGGVLAVAIAEDLEPFDGAAGLPLPDIVERDGWRFASQPVAMRDRGGAMRLERIRSAWSPQGARSVEAEAIELSRLDAAALEEEAEGFEPVERRPIPATGEHVASVVVVLRRA